MKRPLFHLLLWLLLLQAPLAEAGAALQPSTPAPAFALTDLQGRKVRIAKMRGKELLVLLFFDAESRPSLDSLRRVNAVALRHPARVTAYGISSSPPKVTRAALARLGIKIPVLQATEPVRELYQARRILPVGCVIGRGFKVVSYYQGGGEGFTSTVVGTVERALNEVAPPAAATTPAARPAPSRKVVHAGRRQKQHRRAQAATATKAADTAPAAAPAVSAPAATPPPATAAEPQPRAPDRLNPQNSFGKILNDNEW